MLLYEKLKSLPATEKRAKYCPLRVPLAAYTCLIMLNVPQIDFRKKGKRP